MVEPCQIWSKSVKPRQRYGDFSIFQDNGHRHVGFFKFPIFIKRAELRRRAKFGRNRPKRGREMAIFRFFKIAAAAIVDFLNFKLLTVGRIKRVEVRCRAKLGRNRSNRGGDRTIFRFFMMAAAAVLHF